MPVYRRQVEIVYTTPQSENARRSIEGLADTADSTRRRIVGTAAETSRALAQVGTAAAAAQQRLAESYKDAAGEVARFRQSLAQTDLVTHTEETRRAAAALVEMTRSSRENALAAVAAGRAAVEGAGQYGQLRQALQNLQTAQQSYLSATEAQRAVEAEHGRQLDQLRARYIPLVAAQQRYRAQLDELRTAQRAGAFSESEYAAALQRTKDAFAEQVRALNGLSPPLTAGAGQYRNLGMAVQQAGFQVGDFAVQVASGQSPLRAFIQQGTQVVSMFGPWGAAIGAAGAVLGALAVSLFDVGEASADTADALEDYNRMVALSRDLSSEAAGAVRDLAGAHRDASVAAIERSLAAAVEQQDTLRRQIQAQQEYVRVLREGPAFGDELRQAERDLAELTERFDRNSDAIDGLNNRLFVLRDAVTAVTTATTAGGRAQAGAERQGDRQADQAQRLIELRATTVAGLQEELAQQIELRRAHELGASVVEDVTDAREAYAVIQRLNLASDSEEAQAIIDLIIRINDQKRAIQQLVGQQREAERVAQQLAEEQRRAAQEAERAWRGVIDRIGRFSEEALGDSFFDLLRGETLDFAEFFETTILRALANVLAAAATQQIVIPIATQVVGAVPGLFGLSGQAAGVASSAAGFGNSPFSSLTNILPGGDLFRQFAASGIGQSLGLWSSGGAAAAAAAGVTTATPAATLALTGPAGGFGTVAGLGTASTGGMVGAAGLGGQAAGLTALGAAAGPILAAGAIALPLLMGMFGGSPSVGPVGIADFSPGLGRRRAFDVEGIDPFTADNGGDAEGLRPIAEAIAELIADSADRFSATINESLRYRVANYAGPEGGSGRAQGFEVNAFINQEAERRIAEGLSQEQAIFEALRFAVQEAFTFDSATLAEAAANTAATTTEDLLAALDFADSFERTVDALDALGQGVNAASLALAQNTVAVQDAARQYVEEAAGPIVDALETALELFPGTVTRQSRGRESVRSVLVGTVGEDERYLNPADDGYDAAIDAPGARVLDRIIGIDREVTEQAENYAANLERIRDATSIAAASVDLLIQQITGEFEPQIRGPFSGVIDTGLARLEELRGHLEMVNEQITANNEAFPELGAALIDVNQRIAEATAVLFDHARQGFSDSITRQLNEAQGLGGVNAILDLIDTRSANAADAVALGLDANSTAGTLFDAQLRAMLSGSSLADLGAILTSGQILDEGARAILEVVLAEQALAAVRTTEVAGMQSLIAEHQRFADAANDNARTLRQAALSMLTDPNLSPLSPLERLQEAISQRDALNALANDDDPTDAESQDAISRLPDAVQRTNDLARAYYASSEDYAQIFADGQDILNSTALRQESIEQQQLTALQGIEQAILDLGGSIGSSTPADIAAAAGFNFGNNADRNRNIYNQLVSLGLPTPSAFGGGQLNALRDGNPAVDALLQAMGFAEGGLVTGGIPGRDSVPAMLMPGERVFSVPHSRIIEQLAAANQDGGDMRALLAEVRALRRENAELTRQLTQVTAAASLRVVGAVQEGNAAAKRMASAAERNAARPAA